MLRVEKNTPNQQKTVRRQVTVTTISKSEKIG